MHNRNPNRNKQGRGRGGRVVVREEIGGGWGRIRDDYQAPFSQIHCFKKVAMDGQTNGQTDRRMDQPSD